MSPRKKIHDKPGRPELPRSNLVPVKRLAFGQADRLKQALDRRGFTLTQLSTISGIKKASIQRILKPKESQVGALSTTLMVLALSLEINPGWLAYGNLYAKMLLGKKTNFLEP